MGVPVEQWGDSFRLDNSSYCQIRERWSLVLHQFRRSCAFVGWIWVGHCVLVCVVNICYFSVKSPRRNAIQTSSNNNEISCLPDSCMGHQWWCRRDKEQEWRIMLSFKTIFSITLYWETLWEVFRIWSWKPLTVNGTIFGMFITSAKVTSKKEGMPRDYPFQVTKFRLVLPPHHLLLPCSII